MDDDKFQSGRGNDAGVRHPPPRIPDHELLHCIGRGAYGEVWLAKNVLGALRAVKVVYRDRFTDERPYQREFEGIEKYEPVSRGHEGLVDVLQVGRNDEAGHFYCVMELADDANAECETRSAESTNSSSDSDVIPHSALRTPHSYVSHTLSREVSRRGRLPIAECLRIGMALAAALEYLHNRKLAHRDIKPSNVIFVNGSPKLADIGLVADIEGTKSFVGTDGFVPPEGPGTPQADLYSLGKLLYEIATGKSRHQFPEPLTEVAASEHPEELLELNAVILMACRPDARDRYQTAAELGADLAYLASGRSVRKLRKLEGRLRLLKRATLFGGLAVAILFGLYAVNQRERQTRVAAALELEKAKVAAQEKELSLARQLSEAHEKLLFERIEELFATGQSVSAISILAHIVRQNPSNHVAAERLLSVLTDRNFAIPIAEPMQHEGEVYWAEFSPDENRIVTASRDGTARVWDARTGKSLTPPIRHADQVRFACFSPDGRRIVTASFDHTARVWDSETGQPVAPELRHAALVNRAEFSPDGKLVATASKDGTARLWEAETGEPFGIPLSHGGEVFDCQFSPDSKRVVTASQDFSARVWDASTGRLALPPLEHLGGVVFAAFSPDGSRIVTASDDRTAKVWDARTGGFIAGPMQHGAQVRMAQFSPECRRVVTASSDETARVWDAVTGKPITPPLKHSDAIRAAVFSPDGLRVATASTDFTARVWDAGSGAPVTEVIRHAHKLRSVQFGRGGACLLTASADKTARIWDVRNGAAMGGVPWGKYPTPLVGSERNGQRELGYASSGQPDSQNVRGVWYEGELRGVVRHRDVINVALFSADGRRIVTASDDGTAQVWDASTQKKVGEPMVHEAPVLGAQFSPDSTRVVTASKDGTARVWATLSGRAQANPMWHGRQVRYAEFSLQGDKIVTASDDTSARLWDATTGHSLTSAMSHPDIVLFAHFSPDGRYIISAAKDFTVRIWQTADGRAVTPALKHPAEIMFADFSQDGTFVATACEDKAVRVWDAKSGRLISGPMRHNQALMHMVVSPDGRRIAALAKLDTTRLWDTGTGLPLSEPKLIQYCRPGRLEFSLDGESILVLCLNARIEFRLPPIDFAVPTWLPDLAEAVIGMHWVEGDGLEPLPEPQLGQIRKKLEHNTSNDYCSSWARWFFADRGTRTISP